MRVTAHKLAEILMKAAPEAEVRFWSANGEEADLLGVYDDTTDDDDEFALVAEGADTVNFDFEPILDDELPAASDEELDAVGAGDDGWQFDPIEHME